MSSTKRKAHMARNWNRVKDQIVATWGEDIDEDSLKNARGDLQLMVRLIEEQTGEEPDTIRRKVMAFI